MRSPRRLLPLFLLAIASCAAQPSGSAQQVAAWEKKSQAEAGRQDVLLDEGWKFVRRDEPAASAAAFDDAAWTALSLPHTWNNLDGQDGGNNYYRGPAWYRRHLAATPAAGKTYVLKFDGAATVTDVYLNGRHVGRHAGNFAAFSFDITPLLRPGDNVLAVRVDNTRNPDITPISGDFTIFGGLYRPVHLLTLDNLSVSPFDAGSPGVYLKQTKVTAEQAEVDVTVKLRNGYETPKEAAVSLRLLDASGKELQKQEGRQKLVAMGSADLNQRLTIAAPHLWQGKDDPYVYYVAVDVRDGERLVDRVIQPLGLRFFSVDPQRGFMLNGKPYHLHGVNRHQDRLNKGWAISDADHEEDYKLIDEMGCTAIRLAHYQHAQTFYNLCDQGGMIVWAELSIVDKITETDAFASNAQQQLEELIKQNYNHPSIVMWSLYNELRDEKIRPGGPEAQYFYLITKLHRYAHELDPTRLTVAASCVKNYQHPMHFLTDLIAFNWYYGWYPDWSGTWKASVDKLEQQHGDRPVAMSEYGAGASVYQHEIPPRVPQAGGRWHPEEYQMLAHETAYAAMKDRPFLWATFLWNMYDFAIDSRREGDTLGRNDKGLVTYDRKIKKDAYFFYQANWTKTLMVHITSSRFTPRPLDHYPVKVYSNCPSVELKVNGKSYGTRQAADHIFVWENVPFSEKTNQLEAIGAPASGAAVRDVCTITIDPAVTTQPAAPAARPSAPRPAPRNAPAAESAR